MKKIVSTWILFSSVLALGLSFVAFAHAAGTPATTDTKDRPALRGARALGPFSLFDANHDGVISADEIRNAADALWRLDKNGDGKLASDELRPNGPPPPRAHDDEPRDGPDGDRPPL